MMMMMTFNSIYCCREYDVKIISRHQGNGIVGVAAYCAAVVDWSLVIDCASGTRNCLIKSNNISVGNKIKII